MKPVIVSLKMNERTAAKAPSPVSRPKGDLFNNYYESNKVDGNLYNLHKSLDWLLLVFLFPVYYFIRGYEQSVYNINGEDYNEDDRSFEQCRKEFALIKCQGKELEGEEKYNNANNPYNDLLYIFAAVSAKIEFGEQLSLYEDEDEFEYTCYSHDN